LTQYLNPINCSVETFSVSLIPLQKVPLSAYAGENYVELKNAVSFNSLKEALPPNFMVANVRPDGHCLMYAICMAYSMHKNLKFYPLTKEKLMAILISHLINNLSKYQHFFEDEDFKKIFQYVFAYLVQNQFDNNFVDMMPTILANALEIDLEIIQFNPGNNYASIVGEGSNGTTLYLVNDENHYVTILPKLDLADLAQRVKATKKSNKRLKANTAKRL